MADTHVCPSCGSERVASGPPGPCVTCLTRWGSDQPQRGSGTDPMAPPGFAAGASGTDRFGVTRGFEAPDTSHAAGRSVLATLAEVVGDVPHVLLHDTDSGPPVVRPASEQMPRRQEPGARFQIVGEIARGGMGAILRGRDVDLGRDLAIKVLLASHRRKPELVRRFVEEAQISGQLQHPGIIPIYDMGTFADRRPYFTMKLVKGSTLAALLADRPDPQHEQGKLLKVFEQVCQTVAYAHSRGVIHRDLKPSNIMVGSFGEVQVMDWGLAKVLEAGGLADERDRAERSPAETIIQTLRSAPGSGSAGTGDESRVGSLMGTPAYMPPEQALGQVGSMDRRSDVFGLGAILCEILTGVPPYGQGSSEEVVRRALRGDVAEALLRLEAWHADGELVELTRQCLAAEPKDRPRDAGVVAARITAHLEGVQDRLRRSELDKVRAQARAARMKSLMTAAASLLILLAGGGTTALVLERQARDRNARFEQTLAVAEGLQSRIAEASGQRVVEPSEWNEVLAAVESAARLMPGSVPAALRDRSAALEQNVRAGREAAEGDRKLLAALAEARFAQQDLGDEGTDAAFVSALAEAGLDFDKLPAGEAASRLKQRPPPVAAELAPYLDALADLRRRIKRPPENWRPLLAAAKVADPDPYRAKLRTLVEADNLKPALPKLKALAGDEHVAELAPASAVLLCGALRRAGDEATAMAVLTRSAEMHPDDLWVNYTLAGMSLGEDALRYYTAARAIRPETAHDMAHLLQKLNRHDEALAIFEDLTRRLPDNTRHLGCLGYALDNLGRQPEARTALDRAVTGARRRIVEKPNDAQAYLTVGYCLTKSGDAPGAIAAYLEGLRAVPLAQDAMYANLMQLLSRSDDLPAAAAAYAQALRLRPLRADAAEGLVATLEKQGRLQEALAVARQTLGTGREIAPAYERVGAALRDKGQMEESAAAHRESIRLDPSFYLAHDSLGSNLVASGEMEAAVAAFGEAVRLKPDYALGHAHLGSTLLKHGKPKEAAEALLRGVRLGFTEASAREDLFAALDAVGKADESLTLARQAFPPKPELAPFYDGLGTMMRDHGRLDDAVEAYREAARLQPEEATTHARLGLALFARGEREAATAAYQQVARLHPGRVTSAESFVSLARQGDAIHEWAAELLLASDDASAHAEYVLGLLQLTFGRDPAAYAKTARGLMDRYGQTQHAGTAEQVARLCALSPDAPVDRTNVATVAERAILLPGANTGGAAVSRGVGYYVAGLAHYRAGNYRQAILRLEDSMRADAWWPATGLNYPVLAMAHRASGDKAEAEQWLEKSERAVVRSAQYWHDHVELALLRDEARALIRGTQPPAEFALVSPGATTEFYLMRLRRPAGAAALLSDAIGLRPNDLAAHASLGMALAMNGDRELAERAFAEADRLAGNDFRLHVMLADAYARLGHWPQAAAALERVTELDSADHWHYYRAAPLFLMAGDREGYRRICGAMVRRYGGTDRPDVAERISKALLLDAATSDVDSVVAVKLADLAVAAGEKHEFYWYFQLAKGLAELRAGHDAAAIEWLGRRTSRPAYVSPNALAAAIAAMAHHRLGHAEQARAALANAQESLARGPDLDRGRPFEGDWHDWLMAQLLVREAGDLVNSGAGDDRDHAKSAALER